jgi:nucleoside-diphosphate-sugar epimerase
MTEPIRIAVTGAGGFIGRHAVEELAARGIETHGISRHDGVDLLLDTENLADWLTRVRPTHLLHLAWYAEPGKYWTSLENYRWVSASVELARLFREHGGQRMVATGTCAEYDSAFPICSEDETPLRPTTPYGVAKDATRRLLEAYAQQSGLSLAWARIFFLYGPGERTERLVPAVIRPLLRGEDAACTEGRQVRDFLHVRDVAAALVHTLLSEVTGAVNIASGDGIPVRQLVTEIANEIGGTGQPRFGSMPPRDEPPSIVAEVTRLRDAVGFTPRLKRDEGLRDTIRWWRQQE